MTDKICRLCLRKDGEFYGLISESGMAAQLKEILNFEVIFNPILPRVICLNCCKILSFITEYKLSCERVNNYLNEVLRAYVCCGEHITDNSVEMVSQLVGSSELAGKDCDNVVNISDDSFEISILSSVEHASSVGQNKFPNPSAKIHVNGKDIGSSKSHTVEHATIASPADVMEVSSDQKRFPIGNADGKCIEPSITYDSTILESSRMSEQRNKTLVRHNTSVDGSESNHNHERGSDIHDYGVHNVLEIVLEDHHRFNGASTDILPSEIIHESVIQKRSSNNDGCIDLKKHYVAGLEIQSDTEQRPNNGRLNVSSSNSTESTPQTDSLDKERKRMGVSRERCEPFISLNQTTMLDIENHEMKEEEIMITEPQYSDEELEDSINNETMEQDCGYSVNEDSGVVSSEEISMKGKFEMDSTNHSTDINQGTYEKLMEMQIAGTKLTPGVIKVIGLKVAVKLGLSEFSATDGWLYAFMKRCSYSQKYGKLMASGPQGITNRYIVRYCCEELNESLFKKCNEIVKSGMQLSEIIIKSIAMKLAHDEGLFEFCASIAWYRSFKKKYSLKLAGIVAT